VVTRVGLWFLIADSLRGCACGIVVVNSIFIAWLRVRDGGF